MARSGIKKWEMALITLAVLALAGGGYLYLTGFPIGQYLFGLTDSSSGKQIATLTRADGGVRRQKVGDSDFQGVAGGAGLYNEDTLVTPPDGTARIEFTDGSFIEMAPSTMVKLSFSGDLTLGGVVRTTNVQVLTGNVTGISKSNSFNVKNGNEKIALMAPRPAPKPKPTPKETPRPVFTPPPAPSPSPSPSPTPSSRVVIIYPKSGSALAIPTGSQTPELALTFEWQVQPRVKAVSFRLLQRAQKTVVLFKKNVSMNQLNGKLPLGLKRPGVYRWEIASVEKPNVPIAAANFTVEPKYEALTVNDVTVGGTRASTTRLTGKVLKNFDLTFSWQPYAGQKTYELSFFLEPNGKSIWSRQVDGTFYTMNEGKVFTGQIYYQIAARTPNGFLVTSPVKQFSFQFSSPVPKLPVSGTAYSKTELLKSENQVLLTWEKTNFTEGYEVQISSDPSFQTVSATQRTGENFLVLKDPKLGTYYWRVQGFSGNQKSSNPSTISSFTVAP